MENKLLQAMLAHYNAELLKGEATLLIYFKNPAGIGEHPGIIDEMIKLVDKIASARDSIELLNGYITPAQPVTDQVTTPTAV